MSTSNPHNQTQKLPFHAKNQRNKNTQADFQPFRTPLIPRNQEICNQFKMGNCRYGGKCRYKHEIEQRLGFYEMGQLFEGQRMENRGLRGCKWSLEMCPFAKKCVFGHKSEGNCKRMLERSVAKRGCRVSGQEVAQMNLRKTRLCHKYEEFGSCPYGGACHYAHGREELKHIGSVSSLGLKPNAFPVNLLTTLPMNRSSGRKGSSSYEQKKQGRKSLFKWNDIEKMSRIYADWIDLAPVY